MPKDKQSLSRRLKSLSSEFGDDVFSVDNVVLFCKLCEVKVDPERRSSIIQHIKTEKHRRATERQLNKKTNNNQQLLTNLTSKKSPFNMDLCRALISANIPLNKLQNTEFRNFLQIYTQKDIPNESTLRKFYLDECYEEMMKNIRQRVFLKKIWISIDETTDAEGRQIANAIIGTLEEDRAGDIFLLNTDVLEKTNHSTVCKFFDKSLSILWPDGIKHDDVLLFLSDAAPYMVKCGKTLNALYSKMIHVTCAAHGLHRTSEEVRGQFSTIDKIVSNVKKIFKKAPSRIQIFKSHAPNIPLPPDPVITRWGTWLNSSIYYCEYYEQIFEIVQMLNSEDALCIKIAKKNLEKECVKSNLLYIKSNFKVLSDAIFKLQKKNMSLVESLDILDKVKVQLQMAKGNDGQKVHRKFETVLNKNSGLQILTQISKILSGESIDMDGLPEDLTTNDLSFYKFAPITSVDVERSFSIYKNLLTDNRRSFKLENIRKHLLLQCNSSKIIK